jgi:hypothetical protein
MGVSSLHGLPSDGRIYWYDCMVTYIIMVIIIVVVFDNCCYLFTYAGTAHTWTYILIRVHWYIDYYLLCVFDVRMGCTHVYIYNDARASVYWLSGIIYLLTFAGAAHTWTYIMMHVRLLTFAGAAHTCTYIMMHERLLTFAGAAHTCTYIMMHERLLTFAGAAPVDWR